MKMIAIAVMSLSLVACASSGVQVSQQQATQFEKGRSTSADVVKAFGAPTTSMTLGNGERMLVYSFAQVKTRGASFIPVVGLFAGGSDTHVQVVSFRFTPDDRLIDYTASESNYGAQMGTTTATMQTTSQPR